MLGLCFDPNSNKLNIPRHFQKNQENFNTDWVFSYNKGLPINFVTCDNGLVVMLKKVLIVRDSHWSIYRWNMMSGICL